MQGKTINFQVTRIRKREQQIFNCDWGDIAYIRGFLSNKRANNFTHINHDCFNKNKNIKIFVLFFQFL